MTTILQLSDTHLRREVGEADGCLERAIDAVLAACRPDLVLLTGDLADDGSREATSRVRRIVGRSGAPIVATGGNHDDAGVIDEVFGRTRSMELGAWRIELLDSARPGEVAGTLDVEEALERIDAAAPKPTLVALHHPPKSASTHEWFQVRGGDAFVAALARRPHVRAVVSGHMHDSFEHCAGGVRYVGAPSTWKAIRHSGDTYEIDPNGATGAHVFELGDDGALRWWLVPRLPG